MQAPHRQYKHESDVAWQAQDLRTKRGRTFILASVNGAITTRQNAYVKGTKEKRSRAFQRWKEYLRFGGIAHDFFLQDPRSLKGLTATDILGGFAFVLRLDWFASNRGKPLMEATVRQYVGAICAEFVDRGYADPSRQPHGDLVPFFKDLFSSFRKTDRPTKRKAALPSKIFSALRSDKNEISLAIGELCNGALHFAMRACEFSTTPAAETKTDIVTIDNVKFIRGKRFLTSNFATADAVMITFTDQKNGEKNESIVRRRSTSDKFCAVRTWAQVVNRISGYPGAPPNSPVNTVSHKGKLRYITSDMIKARIRTVVSKLEPSLPLESVTPHSIRATYATILFKQGKDLDEVKLMGRWKSDAFLLYIRKNTLSLEMSDAINACHDLSQYS